MLIPTDITPSSYNPRAFMESNFDSLGSSMTEFSDISGITFNKRTGNLVTGHNRWELLCQSHGVDNLELGEVEGTEKLTISNKGIDTGFMLRVVDWELDKEKMANVTANAGSVSGYFTSALSDIVKDVFTSNKSLVKKLGLDSIKVPKVKAPKLVGKETVVKKSETLISGGGEMYVTVKLELTPDTVESLHELLDRFKMDGDKVDDSLKRIIKHMESVEVSSTTKRRRRK